VKNSLLLLTLLFLSTALVNGQTRSSADNTNITITAESLERHGPVVLCRGDVAIATGAVVLHADEADYDTDSGEVALRGNVRVKLLSAAKASCEGTGCVSANNTQAAVMKKIAEPLKTAAAPK
jgi:lipopolysaccharide assembly outer membrane protein LptD (OstA)